MRLSEENMKNFDEKTELDDEELNRITGGFGNSNGRTMMICENCKYAKAIPGQHKGERKKCPSCNKEGTLVGKFYLG